MSILLTGGSGFIGGHFHNKIPNGLLINLDLQEPKFDHSGTYVKGDIRVKEDLERTLNSSKVSTIISLAAKHHDFGIGHDEYFDTNEEGTKVICETASQYNIKEIVFYSSVAVYGLREEKSTEDIEPKPDSAYGASKLAGERVLHDWAAADLERKVLIIRPTLVFGSNNMANMRNLIQQIDSGLYFHLAKANNIKSIAYVENLVDATLFLLNMMKPGVAIYNYADEPQLTTRQIGDIIATELKRKIRLSIPRKLGVLAGIPFDIAIKLTGRNLPISTARIKKLGTQTFHSAEKIFKEGFMPKYSSVDGLKKMVEWYKSEQNGKKLTQ